MSKPILASSASFDVSRLKDADQARNLMENARRLGRLDVEQDAFRRLCQIEGGSDDDPVVVQFRQALSAVEEVLRQKHGKKVRAAYTRRKLASVGEIGCLIDWAVKKEETESFKMLVEAGLGDQTGEYVVVRNADRFPPEAVDAARKRLADYGVDIAGAA
jgi:hypothetical protein